MIRQTLTRLLRMALLITLIAAVPCFAASGDEIAIDVDAREIGRGLVHAEIRMPVPAGPLRLVYPRWGADWTIWEDRIFDVTDLHIRASEIELKWRRDRVDLFAIEIDVPPGSTDLVITFDMLLEPGGFTPLLARLYWEQVLFLPAEADLDSTLIAATLHPPARWTVGTALAIQKSEIGEIAFDPVPVRRLIDAPIIAGLFSRRTEVVAPDAPPHHLVVFADDPAMLDVSDNLAARLGPLVTEAGELFGGFPYDEYTMLLAVSDHMSHYALEHLDSSEHYYSTDAFDGRTLGPYRSSTPAHELVHSWNGERRKPGSMVPPNLSTPLTTELVWVYEGLTTYLGAVLATRSGFWTPSQAGEAFAINAEMMRSEGGRSWRSLQDTADAARFVSRPHWRARRRGTGSFYLEGQLLWLEVDVIIRNLSDGQRSLDDFCRQFAGPDSSIGTYDLDEIVTLLNGIAAHDWQDFFDRRVSNTRPDAPTEGLEGAGWRLARGHQKPQMLLAVERGQGGRHILLRSGLVINAEGLVDDVFAGSPADLASIPPGSRILAVNHLGFTPASLERAAGPTQLIVEHENVFWIATVEIPEGGNFPILQRIEDRPDLLGNILAPLGPSSRTD